MEPIYYISVCRNYSNCKCAGETVLPLALFYGEATFSFEQAHDPS
jgi:hypothetical protein